ncbi:MAG: hypothetical protein LBQ64_02200 [Bacteroidales bacterium]|jgi:hypothetical protein|nr:hypothetical protein [Bacteroidales bacterium]
MKNNLLKSLAFTAILLLCSCSGIYHYNKVNTTSFSPDHVRLNMDLNDFELLGSDTISVISRTYLGIFKTTDTVNNVLYNFREVKFVNLDGKNGIYLPRELRKAVYKVIEKYPDADFYIPVYSQKQINRLFLGKKQTTTALIKAFKLKQ